MSIYIDAYDGVCGLGLNKQEIMQNIINNKPFTTHKTIQAKEFRVIEIATLPYFTKEVEQKYQTRTNAILHCVLLNLQDSLRKILKRYRKDRIGVVIGTTTSGVEENYQAIDMVDSTLFFLRNSLGNPSSFVRDFLGLESLSFGVSSACTSGAKVFIEAARLLELNLCDAVICGGVDSLNTLTIYGFDSLEILSRHNAIPFSKNREGINLGEGAALFVLSKEESPICLKGYCANNDAFHITKPSEDFSAQKNAILNALKMANLETSSIDYINLHGTGTLANDKMEAHLMHTLFSNTLCSSTKGLMGHTLGAAGALEIMVCAEVLMQSVNGDKSDLPLNFYDKEYDGALPNISLINTKTQSRVKNTLSTSFAFGGDNSVVILGV